MRLYGLTGGIASGKSSAARVLRELGATVIDADLIAREVVAPGTPGWGQIRTRWPQVVGRDGTLDRKMLGEIVFSDPGERAVLEAITHPLIAEASAREIMEAEARGERFAFYEAALLVENGLAAAFDGLVVVSAPEELQLERLMKRDALEESAARARLATQLPLSEKVRHATWVLENDGGPDALREATERLFHVLGKLSEGDDA